MEAEKPEKALGAPRLMPFVLPPLWAKKGDEYGNFFMV
jgi:hypothetical protein